MAVALAGALGGGGILSSIIGAVISFAISYIINKAFAPEEEERQDPKDQGVKQRIATDPRNKLPVVYGTKSVSGQITYAEISNDNQRMAFIISLAEGPVSSINSVKWEDKTISFSGTLAFDSGDENAAIAVAGDTLSDDGESDNFLSGRFRCKVFPAGGRCREMESFSSGASRKWVRNTADTADLTTAELNAQRSMPDTAYAFVELTYDQEKRVTSLSSRLQFGITGKMVKPLTSSTNAESYAAASEATSNNPAEIVVDYLTNTRYGAGVPLSAIDFASFNSHKDFCADPLAEYTRTPADVALGMSATGTAIRYTSNGVINTNQDVDQNISDLTIGNSGFITWNYGQFGIVSDRIKVADSNARFSEDNIFGKLQISKLGFDNKLNEITAKFDSAKSKEQEEQIIRSVPASNMNDNEPVLERTVTLPLTNNAIEARRVTAIYLNKSRQDLTVNFTTSIAASGIESGDIIEIAHDTPGWPTQVDLDAGRSGKPFIVHSVEEKVVGNIIGLEITAQEYADSIYEDTINDRDTAPNTRLPNPFATPSIVSLTAVEDVTIAEPNVVLTWLDGANSTLINDYEINYAPTTLLTAPVGAGATVVPVASTAGFPEAGSITIGNETFNYTELSEDGLNFISTTDTIDITRATDDAATLTARNFRTVSGGRRYEISPLVAEVNYTVDVTPVSTLGNRGDTSTAIGITGAARIIGEAGEQGDSISIGTITMVDEETEVEIINTNGTTTTLSIPNGSDGVFSRTIYRRLVGMPPTPVGGSLTGTPPNHVAPPDWFFQPPIDNMDQLWKAVVTFVPGGDSFEITELAYGGTSGTQTGIPGVSEDGFFDISGTPGVTIPDSFEISTVTAGGTSFEQTFIAGVSEDGFFDISGTPGVTIPDTFEISTVTAGGTTSVVPAVPAAAEVQTLTQSGTRSNVATAGSNTTATIELGGGFSTGTNIDGTAIIATDCGTVTQNSGDVFSWPTTLGTSPTVTEGWIYEPSTAANVQSTGGRLINNTNGKVNMGFGCTYAINITLNSTTSTLFMDLRSRNSVDAAQIEFSGLTGMTGGDTRTGTATNFEGAFTLEHGDFMYFHLQMIGNSDTFNYTVNSISVTPSVTGSASTYSLALGGVFPGTLTGTFAGAFAFNANTALDHLRPLIVAQWPAVTTAVVVDDAPTTQSASYTTTGARDTSGAVSTNKWSLRTGPGRLNGAEITITDWDDFEDEWFGLDPSGGVIEVVVDEARRRNPLREARITLQDSNNLTTIFATFDVEVVNLTQTSDYWFKLGSIVGVEFTDYDGVPSNDVATNLRVTLTLGTINSTLTIDTGQTAAIAPAWSIPLQNQGETGTDDASSVLGMAGSGVLSTYTVFDNTDTQVGLPFTGFAASTDIADADFVTINSEIESIIDNNAQAPINFLASVSGTSVSGNTIVLTAQTTGPVADVFNVRVDHGTGNGNLAYGNGTLTDGDADETTEGADFAPASVDTWTITIDTTTYTQPFSASGLDADDQVDEISTFLNAQP